MAKAAAHVRPRAPSVLTSAFPCSADDREWVVTLQVLKNIIALITALMTRRFTNSPRRTPPRLVRQGRTQLLGDGAGPLWAPRFLALDGVRLLTLCGVMPPFSDPFLLKIRR